ncbi:PQQ-dependent sugar dehydrogenase [Pseudochryseolinea flava]|uniref:PQQ-dependent sugar dehydrogenase n=1 Tax=Pseudochryseolinea flava TaxID=2059302 RepID=A0A364XZT7_9BACT|nr:PQQ-dependent sugar dehydrogenase [Pseudochryseolinea flava]RAV99837.1 PQQ-dependent sugar dehydrogenase [Pseudochryseolinea flava]
MKTTLFAPALFIALAFIGCDKRQGNLKTIESENQQFAVDTLAKGLTNPWGAAFLPDGKILITERKGVIRIFKDGELQEQTIEDVPAVFAKGQGGLLDITLHPDYATNGWIYLTYSKPGANGASTTVSRAKLDGNKFVEFQELFSAQPFVDSDYHFGSRIVFDGEGHMFVSSGERGDKPSAQTLSNHLGKVLRLNDDGSVPKDNPFVNTPDAKPEIWSYGHRNPQGLFYDRDTKTLWEAEHGPKGGDELNRVEKGKNYGWPIITYGIDYDGKPISDITEKEGLEQPVFYWVPSIATCGITQVKGELYPGWKNNILVGGLILTHVARIELNDKGQFLKQEKLLDKVGRVRLVTQDAEGYLYVLTESPGLLLKLIPVKK